MARKPTASLPDVFAKPGGAPARGTPIEALPRDDAAPVAAVPGDAAAAEPASPADRVTAIAGVSDASPVTIVPQVAPPEPVDSAAAGRDMTAGADIAAEPLTVVPAATPVVLPSTATVADRMPKVGGDAVAPRGGMDGAGPSQAGTTQAPVQHTHPEPKPTVTPTPAMPQPVAATPASSGPSADPVRVAAAEPVRPVPSPAAIAGDAQTAPTMAPPAPPERGAPWGIAIAALAVSLTTPFWYDGALRLLGYVPSLHRAQLEDALTLSRQERKLREVEQRLSTASTQLTRTQADLAQANRAQQEAAAWTRMVVVARLAEAVRSGRPFVSELAVARTADALAGDFATLAAVIAPYAPIGVPTMDDLGRDFRRLTDPVLRPARGLNPLAWASAAFAYLPFGRAAVDPDPARAALREAAALVEGRRVFDAAARLRPLTGPVREGMAGWLADVDARAAADALDRRVEAALRPGRG